MAEVVLKLSDEEFSDGDRLCCALDAYAEWCEKSSASDDPDVLSDFIMTTEYDGDCKSRKLIFQDQEHASRFMVFWKTQKQHIPLKKFEY